MYVDGFSEWFVNLQIELKLNIVGLCIYAISNKLEQKDNVTLPL